jgi:poly(A) polymerase
VVKLRFYGPDEEENTGKLMADYAYFCRSMDIHCTDRELFIFRKIGAAAKNLQLPCYVIGGFVRDKCLGRPSKDADIVCVGDGIALAHEVASRFHPTPTVSFFKTYGTAQIKIDDFEIEFVGARKESYRQESRNPEVQPGSLEDDQWRRDFTINAMAISLNEDDFGKLLDPFQGIADLENKIIRTPLDPKQTFSDDPLRMMRAIRFATQLNFSIVPETFQAICENAHRINIITQERITVELNKILASPKPSIGFDLLYKSGILKLIFPQMVDLAGAEYIDGKGHKDNFYHTLQVIDNVAAVSSNLWLRWAALLHDIGKPATKRFEPGHGWTFHGHEVVGGKMVPKIFTKLKLPLHEQMRFVKKLVELHLRPISLTKENISDSAIRRLLFDAGDDLDQLMMLCEADITSKNKFKVKRYLENFSMVRRRLKEVEESDRVRNWQPPISGDMIMRIFGLSPSREVGMLKNAIREAILDGEVVNQPEPALAFLKEKAASMQLTSLFPDAAILQMIAEETEKNKVESESPSSDPTL